MPQLIGSSLGSYRIIEQIGIGGMATIYKAYDPDMERYVAIKVLPSHFNESPEFVERFKREARVIANLEHPNILPVYSFGEEDGTTYIAMRYLPAGTLKDLLEEGKLSLSDIAKLIRKIANALDFAHERDVIHRDIKPSNILIDQSGIAYLMDFGLAKIMEGSTALTTSGAILGTPDYIAPEQALGQIITSKVDIYALGVALYEMVTGRVPFQADTPMAVAFKHVHEPLPLPREINPDISYEVENIILKALAKDPLDRYEKAGDLSNAFAEAVEIKSFGASRELLDIANKTAKEKNSKSVPPMSALPQEKKKSESVPLISALPQETQKPKSVSPVTMHQENEKPTKKIRRWGILIGGGLIVGALAVMTILTGVFLYFSNTTTPVMVSGTNETIQLTPSPVPSSTPPQSPAAITFSDDFSSSGSGWDRNDWDNGLTDYGDGVYRMAVKKSSYDIWANPGKNFDGDIRVEVDATKVSGENDNNFGLICRYSGSSETPNFYMFNISSDGFAVIGKVTGGETEYISSEEMEPSDAIRQGAANNHMRADCIGDLLTLYVNGQQVATATDSSFSSGDVGLIAGTFDISNSEINFDNFVVYELEPSGEEPETTETFLPNQPTPAGPYEIGRILFQDDFEDGPSNLWNYQDYSWETREENGNIFFVANLDQAKEAGIWGEDADNWINYLLQFDLKFSKPNQFGFYQIGVKTKNYYCSTTNDQFYEISITPDLIQFVHDDCGVAKDEQAFNITLSEEEWHSFEIVNYMNKFQMYINGNQIFSIVIDKPIQQGGIAFENYQEGQVYFIDNIIVYELGIGEPTEK